MRIGLNKLRDWVLAYAKDKGFSKSGSLGESLMLVVSELSEALEADRKGKWCRDPTLEDGRKLLLQVPVIDNVITKETYEKYVRGTVEEEIADAMLRILGLAGFYDIDLDWHIDAKMAYNKTRPYRCDKNYG
jgi:NTP pyrophosphatase (non-canonical NTP hydrolase)